MIRTTGAKNRIAMACASAVLSVGFAMSATAPGLAAPAQPQVQTVTPAPLPPQAAQGYLIHAHDQLSIQVINDPTLNQNVAVLPGGDIQFQLVGKIHVGGQTPDQAAVTIANALKKYVRHPIVSVNVTSEGSLSVLVLGDVIHPGKYELPPSAHVTDAIAAAGGMGQTNGPLPDARVASIAQPDKPASIVPLEQLLRGGNSSLDLALADQTVVYVPGPTTINIEVTGAVDHPGEIQLNQGDRLSMAIAKAGNSNSADSDLNNIHVTRLGTDGKTQDFNVNLYQELQQGDVSKDIIMQKGDVVFVPKTKHGLNGGSGNTGSPVYLLLIGLRALFPHL